MYFSHCIKDAELVCITKIVTTIMPVIENYFLSKLRNPIIFPAKVSHNKMSNFLLYRTFVFYNNIYEMFLIVLLDKRFLPTWWWLVQLSCIVAC